MKKYTFLILAALFISNGLFSQSAKKIKKQGDTYLKEKNYLAAIEEYTKANTLEPSDFEVLFSRGTCFENLREPQKALSDFVACNKIDAKEKKRLS